MMASFINVVIILTGEGGVDPNCPDPHRPHWQDATT